MKVQAKRKISKSLLIGGTIFMAPYVFNRFYFNLDKLEIWEKRIEQKRVEKMAFDWMLKNYAEKDMDMLEEYSDY